MSNITEEDFTNGLLIKDENGVNAIYNLNDYTIRLGITDEAEDIVSKIENSYNSTYEYNQTHERKATIMVDLKHCSVAKKAEIIKFALQYNKLEDPLMLLNIMNLVKVYNTLDESYFNSDDIFVNSIEELLDLKLSINAELKEFSRRLSIYFLSLLKSFNKLTYTPADEHIELPNLYKSIILSSDLMTLSGIFAKNQDISISDLTYIDNAYFYMINLITKSAEGLTMANELIEAMTEEE